MSQDQLFPTFGTDFLTRHAGRIIAKPDFAIVELVANCWDAGASRVTINWSSSIDGLISVEDNGIGMTEEEFSRRWRELYYNRTKDQGKVVTLPDSEFRKRNAFGRNGIGRHAMFCFADKYFVETRRDGKLIRALVQRNVLTSNAPYDITIQERQEAEGHGTKIYTSATKNVELFDAQKVVELIGSRFVADPEFRIRVNDQEVTFEDLETLSVRVPVTFNDESLVVKRFDTTTVGRTSKQSGIAWWVFKRLVGQPSWDGYDGTLLDARTSVAKRYAYIVEADSLEPFVKEDWSGFRVTDQVLAMKQAVSRAIEEDLITLTKDVRKERAKGALSKNRGTISRLPTASREQIARFVDEVLKRCPQIRQQDLVNTVETLANLEKTRTGYSLIEKLSKLNLNDLEELHTILDEWSINDAKKVLEELYRRLNLIKELEKLVDVSTTDELHELQPLFESGLWIFGPKFEGVGFQSNRSLLTVIKHFFDKDYDGAELVNSRRRPDFVIVPNYSSIGIYSRNAFDSENEVSGIETVIIVELKKGGFTIGQKEKRQAQDYAIDLLRSGRVLESTDIVCYVLGSAIEKHAQHALEEGNIRVYPRTYNTILNQAHARTFNLLKQIESLKNEVDENLEPEIEEILEESGNLNKKQPSLFDDDMLMWGSSLS